MRTLFTSFKAKAVLGLAALSMAFSANATAQTTTGNAEVDPVLAHSNMIVVNPLKFLLHYNLNYYHRLSSSMVIGGGLQMPSLKGFSGFGANAEVRFHLAGKAMKGIYIAPNVSFNSLKYSFDDAFSGLTVNGQPVDPNTDEAISTTAFTVGALVGWQWFIGDDFPIGLGIGYDYGIVSLDAEDEDQKSNFASYEGGTPAFRFDIGYAF